MKFFILHSHFRPGGVRRVIESATPHLMAHWPRRWSAVILAAGESPDSMWLENFQSQLRPTPLCVQVNPALGYFSEITPTPRHPRQDARKAMEELLDQVATPEDLIWCHNLSLGRNLPLAAALTQTCAKRRLRLILHHHDWWFDNRWHHLAAMRRSGFRQLAQIARAIFTSAPSICHVGINRADASALRRHFPGHAAWIPNLTTHPGQPTPTRTRAARAWFRRELGPRTPIWLLPCRLLRRKNMAEAVLLTRWLRPEAWLVTTGGASSAEEQPYARRLITAAQAHGWPVRLAILERDEHLKPSVPELLAASEAILLTSLLEGFGLPYLEAAAAQRPLIARSLPNIAPDLKYLGFRFPQVYDEIHIDPSLFHWRNEIERQSRLFCAWKRLLPRSVVHLAGTPALLAAAPNPQPIPFSRLTFTAQLEVLTHTPQDSWELCAKLNPFLNVWREAAARGRLQSSPWPDSASQQLSGQAFAKRFIALARPRSSLSTVPEKTVSQDAQEHLLRLKLRAASLYPLLWSPST